MNITAVKILLVSSFVALAIGHCQDASAFEGNVTLTIKSSTDTIVVHTNTVESATTKDGKIYATAIVTLVKKDGTYRSKVWHECGDKGGMSGFIGNDGKLTGEPVIWVLGGNTVGDDAGLVICHTATKAGTKQSAKIRM